MLALAFLSHVMRQPVPMPDGRALVPVAMVRFHPRTHPGLAANQQKLRQFSHLGEFRRFTVFHGIEGVAGATDTRPSLV